MKKWTPQDWEVLCGQIVRYWNSSRQVPCQHEWVPFPDDICARVAHVYQQDIDFARAMLEDIRIMVSA